LNRIQWLLCAGLGGVFGPEYASKIRSRVEHVFGVVKRLWGFGKVRYRGLQKNATRAFTALALANIFLGRQRLLAQVRP
jgi:IS5 family transposase